MNVDLIIKNPGDDVIEYITNIWVSQPDLSNGKNFVDASVTEKPNYTEQKFVFRKRPDGPYGSYITPSHIENAHFLQKIYL